MSRDLARYARSGAWSLIAYAVQILGAIVVSVVVVRALTTTEIGVLGQARQIAAGVVALSGLALERTFLRFGPELVQRGGGGPAVRLLVQIVVIRVLAWLPFPFAVWWWQDGLERLFGAGVGTAALVGVGTGISYSLYAQLRAAATARFATQAVARSSIFAAVGTLAATLFALQSGYGVDGVLGAAGFGLLVACVPLIGPAFDQNRRGQLEDGDDDADGVGLAITDRRFVDYAWPFALIAILNHAVHSQTEVLFLGYWHGPDPAGFFSHGFTFAQRLVDFLPLALWEVSMAGFSRLVTRAPGELARAMHSYLVLLYLVMLPLAVVGIAFTPIGTLLLYGEKMMPSVPVAQAYFAVAAVAAVGAPFGMVLYAREKVRTVLGVYLIIALVNVGLDVALIPRMELSGAILGLAVAKIVSVGLMFLLVRRELGRAPIPWSFLGRAAVASAIAIVAWPLTMALGTWVGAIGVFALVVVALGASFRLLRVVGPAEAALVRGTGLPASATLLRLLGHPEGSAS